MKPKNDKFLNRFDLHWNFLETVSSTCSGERYNELVPLWLPLTHTHSLTHAHTHTHTHTPTRTHRHRHTHLLSRSLPLYLSLSLFTAHICTLSPTRPLVPSLSLYTNTFIHTFSFALFIPATLLLFVSFCCCTIYLLLSIIHFLLNILILYPQDVLLLQIPVCNYSYHLFPVKITHLTFKLDHILTLKLS